MTFTESIKTGLSRLMVFSGRAGRSEYGWFSLFLLLVLALLVAGIVLAATLAGARVPYGALVLLLVPLYLAWVSVQVRRLRDAGFSPWWVLADLIPLVGILVVLALAVLPGNDDAGGQYAGETNHGSLSILGPALVTGWGLLTGAGALGSEQPKARNWWPLAGVVLLVVAIIVLALLVAYKYQGGRAPQPALAPAAVPMVAPSSLRLIDDASGARLYYDSSTARLLGPGVISIQLVFDFGQTKAREGVRFLSMKQNEVFNCVERNSSWSTRFYMSEPLGEGAAVLIEEGKGSLLDMSDGEVGNLRLDTVCKLLPGLGLPQPPAAGAN